MLFLSCFVMLSCTSVCCCLEFTCWKRDDLLALVCDVLLGRCHFPFGIMGQVWCLIVSIPDLCPLSYFSNCFYLTRFISFLGSTILPQNALRRVRKGKNIE